MKKVFVLMAACMILAIPSFAQKDKTIKKGGDKKEMVKPRKDKKRLYEPPNPSTQNGHCHKLSKQSKH